MAPVWDEPAERTSSLSQMARVLTDADPVLMSEMYTAIGSGLTCTRWTLPAAPSVSSTSGLPESCPTPRPLGETLQQESLGEDHLLDLGRVDALVRGVDPRGCHVLWTERPIYLMHASQLQHLGKALALLWLPSCWMKAGSFARGRSGCAGYGTKVGGRRLMRGGLS